MCRTVSCCICWVTGTGALSSRNVCQIAWPQCISFGNFNTLPNALLVLIVVRIILVRWRGGSCSLHVIYKTYYYSCCCYHRSSKFHKVQKMKLQQPVFPTYLEQSQGGNMAAQRTECVLDDLCVWLPHVLPPVGPTKEVRAISSGISAVRCRWCMLLSCSLKLQRGRCYYYCYSVPLWFHISVIHSPRCAVSFHNQNSTHFPHSEHRTYYSHTKHDMMPQHQVSITK
jgi:hypothetical protein